MTYRPEMVREYVEEAKQLDPTGFKTLYFWLTEALDWAGHPRGVPQSMLVTFGQMSHWEKANTIDHLGRHMAELCRDDFRRLVARAREWDESQERWRKE
jgi:hypothetical protein